MFAGKVGTVIPTRAQFPQKFVYDIFCSDSQLLRHVGCNVPNVQYLRNKRKSKHGLLCIYVCVCMCVYVCMYMCVYIQGVSRL